MYVQKTAAQMSYLVAWHSG